MSQFFVHCQECLTHLNERGEVLAAMRRIIQIAATDNKLFVLCSDDTLHLYDFTELGWVLLPPVPNGHAALMERLEDHTSLLAEEEPDEGEEAA